VLAAESAGHVLDDLTEAGRDLPDGPADAGERRVDRLSEPGERVAYGGPCLIAN
jgi:hypothetical protein